MKPLRQFFQYWKTTNTVGRHFWHTGNFILEEFLDKIMMWLDAPINTLETIPSEKFNPPDIGNDEHFTEVTYTFLLEFSYF